MKKDNPDFDETTVKEGDYEVKPPLKTIDDMLIDPSSTVEGFTKTVNTIERGNYSTASLFMSEMGLSIQNNQNIGSLFEKFAVSFDMGKASKKAVKGKDIQEYSIKDTYPNLLGISAPTFVYNNQKVKEFFHSITHGAFGRRSLYFDPNTYEIYENKTGESDPDVILKNSARRRANAEILKNELEDLLLEVAKFIENDREVIFNEEAGEIYDLFRTYSKSLASVIRAIDPASPIATALEGKAFITARIAALWTILEKSRVITKDILIAAIYLTMYSNRHLVRFMQKLNNKPYELMVNSYLNDEIHEMLPITDAIKLGFIEDGKHSSNYLKTFLQPVNSLLKGVATVVYSDTENSFIFTKEQQVEKKTKESPGDYSYSIFPKGKPANKTIKKGMYLQTVFNAHILDSVINPFVKEQGGKFITLSVIDSDFSIEAMHKYLYRYTHLLIPTGDEFNYKLVLPVNFVIKSEPEYRYITASLYDIFMLNIDKTFIDNLEYTNNKITKEKCYEITEGEFFDIGDFKTNFANKENIKGNIYENELTPSKFKDFKTELLESKSMVVELLNTKNTDVLRILMIYLKDFTIMKERNKDKITVIPLEEIKDIIDNINVLLDNRISKEEIENYLIEPITKIRSKMSDK
jgi:hypothetical protein